MEAVTSGRSARSDGYDGIPYDQLVFDDIDWREAEDHIRNLRTGRPGELDIEPEWADGAVSDPQRVVGDSRSRSGESVKVIGYSQSAGRVLIVLLVPKSHPPSGEWWGVSAWVANEQHERAYRQRG